MTATVASVVRDVTQALVVLERIVEDSQHVASTIADRDEKRRVSEDLDALRRSIRSEYLTLASKVENLESDRTRDLEVAS